MSPMVARPIASVRPSRRPGWIRVLNARVTRLAPSARYPVRSASWPSTMFTPTALMKPTITAFDTKRSAMPSFNRPAISMATPVSSESVTRARVGSLESRTADTSAITIAMAPVPCTAMNVELAKKTPVAVPIM